MTVVSISMDVEALARAASQDHAHAVQFVHEDFGFGLTSERSVARGLTYPLKRLRGLSLITEAEEERLGQILDAVSRQANVTPLMDALHDASPVAVALARLIGEAHSVASDRLSIAAGAIAGAYLGLTLRRFSSPGVSRDANSSNDNELDAAISIMAAVGGTLAISALAMIQTFQASQPPSTSSASSMPSTPSASSTPST